MLRMLFTLCIYVLVARWIYAEVGILFPQALPVVDKTLAKVQLPTHDQWSKDSIVSVVSRVALVTAAIQDRYLAPAQQKDSQQRAS